MNEMIDRVARAIVLASLGSDELPISDQLLEVAYKPLARAAIEAMREPTENMLFVGSNEEAGFTARNLLQSWQLMIEEALKD